MKFSITAAAAIIAALFLSGLLLCAPATARTGYDDHFVVMKVVGDVQIRPTSHDDWRAARVGDILRGGETEIKTEDDSTVYLRNGETYEPKSRPTLAIGPKARVRVRSRRDAEKHHKNILDARKGKVTQIG